ncbi:SCO family protein [Aquimarina sp. 2201CG14-23]|uniref:SCO family protein n=1 Tax=Aquimarina mycalae TaxID=3040073 RepID=UPI0024782B4E|nr:SCO family protein [Aquimarina sp. 2201CG14-23]MDH7445565.1 SCO family protein [Aquimarina sp. 2201CG14-23]
MTKYYIILLTLCLFSCTNNKKSKVDPDGNTETVSRLPYFNSTDFTPDWKKGTHKIPNFKFLNQNGDTITNQTFYGKIYVSDFFFTTCPGICPKLTKNMYFLQEHYKNNDSIMFLSHTVMPWMDTVDRLKEYAVQNNIDDTSWNLVTGDKDALYTIARKGYFADEDFIKTQDENNFIHTENFILIDSKGYIRGVYNGTIEIDMKRLIRHIKILQKEV